MGYMSIHLTDIKRRHYVMTATTQHYWYNFYVNRIKEKVSLHGDDFCLIINGSNKDDDAYILPYKVFKSFYTPDYLDENGRWIGTIRGHTLNITARGLPPKTIQIRQYYNAFTLLKMPE